MKKFLGILAAMLTFACGTVHSGECDTFDGKQEIYGSGTVRLEVLKKAMSCALQNQVAAVALIKMELVIEIELALDPLNMALRRVQGEINTARIRHGLLSAEFEKRANKLETELRGNSIMTPDGRYWSPPKKTTM